MKIFESVCNFLRGRLLTCLLFCGVVFIAPLSLAAQQGSGATIYHAAGGDFVLDINGQPLVFPAAAVGAAGLSVDRSAIIHNGPGTFLEVQLVPSGTVIKVAENTSLVYNGLDETGKFEELSFLYGRVRIVTGDAGTAVVLRCGSVSTRLTNGDFGADYLLEPDDPNSVSRPLLQVYSFRGSAKVFPYGAGGSPAYFGSAENLTANQGECLFLDVANSKAASKTFAEKKPIDRNAAAYWISHGFEGTPAMPMPDTRLALEEEKKEERIVEVRVPEPVIQTVYVEPPQPIFEKQPAPVYYGKNVTLGIGLLLTISSAVVMGVTHPNFIIDYENKDLVRNIHSMSYLPLGLGLLTIFGGIMYNPTRN